jgi:GDP-L-fucose synthase
MAGARPEVRGPLNLGSDEEITIADLAALIIETSGMDTEVILDPTRPDGQPRRACDSSRARQQLGFESRVSLRAGLERTIRWFERASEMRAS